ncbi:ATP synthase-coupling factor 6, mitochondrial [Trichonephila clavata]|uniref:ATP synthase-coupling factor 6, mitochondrial n=1 Tax=Trichonephila clavata TaxID=2740835 RepID=A0A8X6GCQ2_TRICU|nr:ATP synthase-coupling factor 6, mitochondrial [Trichonephila clavata]
MQCIYIEIIYFFNQMEAMNTVKILRCGNAVRNSVVLQRNFGVCSVLMTNKTATDPIQKLFLEKLKEYNKRSGGGGKFVDVSPEKQKEYDEVLLNLKKQYGADKGEDFTKFPTFNFPEPILDPINMDERPSA